MQLPSDYLSFNEAWPEWLSRRFPATTGRLFDPDRYRPSVGNGRSNWHSSGPDPITGECHWEPDQETKDYAETVPDRTEYPCRYSDTGLNVAHIQNSFWKDFCRNKNGNAIIHRDGEWQALHNQEWAHICDNLLWQKVVFFDPDRADWGPKKWLSLAMGDKIPTNIAVHRTAFADFLADGRDWSDLSISEQLALSTVEAPEDEIAPESERQAFTNAGASKQLSPDSPNKTKRPSKPVIVANLLREWPEIETGTNLAVIEALERKARERGLIGKKEEISLTTLRRARKITH